MMLDVRQRNEILQDVIDRLLYLPEDKLQTYLGTLSNLTAMYDVDVEVINGIRVYKTKRYESTTNIR